MNNAKHVTGKTSNKIIAKIMALAALCAVAHSLQAVESPASDARKAKIANIIKEFVDAKVNLADPFIQEAIIEKVGKSMILEPKESPITKTAAEVAKVAREQAAKKYPLSREQLKKKVTEEAKNKYKAAQKGQYVSIHVQRGNNNYVVSGVYYGLGIGKNSARIGDDIPIPFFDMIPVDRAKFDANFRAKEIQKYVKARCSVYQRRKSIYANDLYNKALEKIARENEKRGYIRAWGKWRTPKSVTEYFIAQYIRKMPEVASNDNNPTATPKEGAQPDNPSDGDDQSPEETTAKTPSQIKTDPQTTLALQLDKLKAEVEKRQIEISGSRYGVDADQTFKHGNAIVLMGMRSGNVDLILKKKLPDEHALPRNDAETITYDSGPIASVTLYYINDVLYKIKKTYRIASLDIMADLIRRIVDDYGKSIETLEAEKKEEERRARIAKVKNPCKNGKHHFNKSGVCTKCGMRKKDLAPEPETLEQIHHWKGDVVDAELHFKLNNDRSDFEVFELTRERPDIKKDQEAVIEEERRKREEENKRKIREQYKLQ